MYRGVVTLAAVLCGWTLSAMAFAGPIIDGREWYQPADITGYSWWEFNDTCPYNGGGAKVCSGNVGGSGPDLSGWTWATVEDVDALFNTYLGAALLGGRDTYTEIDSTWAPLFFDDFQPILTTPFGRFVDGMVSQYVTNVGLSTVAAVGSLADVGFPQGEDRASIEAVFNLNSTDDAMGGWFYREAGVSTPGTLLLIGIGLFAIGWLRRSKQ